MGGGPFGQRVKHRDTMGVTHGETKGSPRGLPSGSPSVCYHQENLLVTVPVLLVFLSLHDVHGTLLLDTDSVSVLAIDLGKIRPFLVPYGSTPPPPHHLSSKCHLLV